VAHALQEAFRGLLMTGRQPVGFLFLEVPPDKVDVNVHPTKAEVRFQENSLVYSLVRATVKARLLRENLVPRLSVPEGQEVGGRSQESGVRSQEEHAGLFSPRQGLADRTVAPWDNEYRPLPPSPSPAGGGGDRTNGFPSVSPPPAGEGPGVGSFFLPSPARQERIPFGPAGTPPPNPLPATERGDQTEPASSSSPPPPGGGKEREGGGPGEGSSGLAPPPPAGEGDGGRGLPVPALPPFPLPSPGTALQVHDSYLVLETPDGMLVIDQHALHERILFEQLRRRVREGRLEVQRLLIPEPIDLPAEQAALVLEAADALRDLGLEVSDFGGNTVLLSSYPTLLGRKPPHEIFRGVVDYLLSKERPPTRDALMHHLTATMACKAAVKAGDKLTPEEIRYLLHLRDLADDSHHCPHGRPTSLLFSRQDLDKQFRRI
ncbi:MAG: DNA mismatch repair protein MutL, partial [Gemmataceae bacterium]|nr:DNA mismatch repair protein MutL [Gemmataceae bacterium]